MWRGSEAIVFKHYRTAKDIEVLDGCEIPPIRTEFLELLGEGAFGKVHKATLKDGMAYFEDERDWPSRTRKPKIIAVKELFGEFKFVIYHQRRFQKYGRSPVQKPLNNNKLTMHEK